MSKDNFAAYGLPIGEQVMDKAEFMAAQFKIPLGQALAVYLLAGSFFIDQLKEEDADRLIRLALAAMPKPMTEEEAKQKFENEVVKEFTNG